MKNQWPFWLFVIAIVAVVVISLNYQGKNDAMPLGEIFPEDQALDYEYAGQPNQQQGTGVAKVAKPQKAVASPVKKVETPPAPVVAKESKPVVKSQPVSQPSASSVGAYTIQVLSSKDKAALEKALKKTQADGFADAYMGTADLGEKGVWYRLYVGNYHSMTKAKERLPKVKEKYSQAFIIKLAK